MTDQAYRPMTHSTDNYWKQFDLRCDPFADTSEQLYLLDHWHEHLELMHHLCVYSNVLFAITGAINCGKTTLLNHFCDTIADNTEPHRLQGHARITPEALLNIISKAFDLPEQTTEDNVTLSLRFTQQISLLAKQRRNAVLIIDDAHQLPLKTLTTLFELVKKQSDEQHHLHFILCGEPELQIALEKIARVNNSQNLLHHIRLTALNRKETEDYLRTNLLSAGGNLQRLFNKHRLDHIYKFSEGYIGRINQVAKQTLLNSLHKKNNRLFTINKKIIVGFAASVAIIFAIIKVAPLHTINPLQRMISYFTIPKTTKTASIPNTQETTVITKKTVETKPSSTKTTVAPANTAKIYFPPLDNTDVPLYVSHSILKQSFEASQHALRLQAIADAKAKAEIIQAHNVAEQKARNARLEKRLLEQKRLREKQATEATIHRLAQEAVQAERPSQPVVLDNVVVIPAIAKKIQTKSQKKAATIPHYSLQLMGSHDLNALRTLVKSKGLQKDIRLVHTINKGQDWYVLVYGHYKTLYQAKQAKRRSPQAIRHFKPWVRNMKATQQLTI